jgi:cell wall-associated NlpC family hydrolase
MYYSYKHNGHTIPRTAQAQYNASHHVSGRTADIGTMVFFGKDPRHVTHVGIYAGKDKRGHSLIWNANTGSYRGRKVVLAPASEYATNGNHGYFGLIG